MTRHLEKLMKFVAFCDSLAELSTCKRAKCGAIVFDHRFTEVFSIGYNGPPSGTPNDACTGEEGKCACCHAEANALMKATQGSWMYSTMFPCVLCAGLIANKHQLSVLVYRHQYRDSERSRLILENAGIEVYNITNLDRIEARLL
jgi:deoxycytidylate deaminase